MSAAVSALTAKAGNRATDAFTGTLLYLALLGILFIIDFEDNVWAIVFMAVMLFIGFGFAIVLPLQQSVQGILIGMGLPWAFFGLCFIDREIINALDMAFGFAPSMMSSVAIAGIGFLLTGYWGALIGIGIYWGLTWFLGPWGGEILYFSMRSILIIFLLLLAWQDRTGSAARSDGNVCDTPRRRSTTADIKRSELLDIPEVYSALSELRERFGKFDKSGLYENYLYLANSVTEWKFSTNGRIFQALPYDCEIASRKTPKLIKRKYKNWEEATRFGKYCSGYLNGECVVVIFPANKRGDSLLVSVYDKKDAVLEEVHVDFMFASDPEKRVVRLMSLSKYIDLPNNQRAKVGVDERGRFSVCLYTFSDNGQPICVKVVAKGRDERIYYFHYQPNGEMYKISNDEAGEIIYYEKHTTIPVSQFF
jgi:hypothetical protein